MPKYPPDILIFGVYQMAWINYMSVFSCNTVCFHFTVILIVPDYVYFFNKIYLFIYLFFYYPSQINLGDASLSFSSNIKLLGVYIDQNLNFSVHINSLASKLSKISGILYSISGNAPESVLINLYYSLVYPHLIYWVLLWGNTASIHLEPLILAQKRIIRIITHSAYLAHTAPIFHRTKILCISNIYRYFIGIHMFKLQLSDSLPYPDHNYQTRYRRNVLPSFQRLTSSLKSISYNGPKIYNTIPLPIRNSKTLTSFKSKYRQYLIDTYL